MTRERVAELVVALVVGAAVLALAAPIGHAGSTNPMTAPSDSNVSTVIAVQGATVDRSIALAEFDARLEDADSENATAAVVADELDRIESRLGDLETRLDRARTARENGSIGEDAYVTRVTPIVASARTLDARLNRLREAIETVDEQALRDAGVTPDRIETAAGRLDDVLAVDAAAIDPGALEPGFYRTLATVVATHNAADDVDLGALGSHVNGERINLYVRASNGETAIVSFRTTEDNDIRELRAGPHQDATLRVTTDEATARQLLDADDPGAATSRAFLDGELKVDGIGWFNALKWLLLTTVVDAVRTITALVGVLVVRS